VGYPFPPRQAEELDDPSPKGASQASPGQAPSRRGATPWVNGVPRNPGAPTGRNRAREDGIGRSISTPLQGLRNAPGHGHSGRRFASPGLARRAPPGHGCRTRPPSTVMRLFDALAPSTALAPPGRSSRRVFCLRPPGCEKRAVDARSATHRKRRGTPKNPRRQVRPMLAPRRVYSRNKRGRPTPAPGSVFSRLTIRLSSTLLSPTIPKIEAIALPVSLRSTQ